MTTLILLDDKGDTAIVYRELDTAAVVRVLAALSGEVGNWPSGPPPATGPLTFYWPTEYPGRLNQAFGANPDVYKKFNLPGHEGLDMFAPALSRIYCCYPGEVFMVEARPKVHNYGIHVRVRHRIDGIEYHTIYAHLKEAKVKVGDQIDAGDLVGLSGSTGNSSGPHLHLTVKKIGHGTYPYDIIDPTPLFKELRRG